MANPTEKPIDEKFTAIDAACDFLHKGDSIAAGENASDKTSWKKPWRAPWT